MFTGIVEEVGEVNRMARRGDIHLLTISAVKALEDIALGDSISVSGVCLTAVEFTGTTFTVEATPETIDRTNLAELRPGSGVNLERAMRLGGKMGGHMVTGHIDGTGRIENVEREGESYRITFQAPTEIMRYIVPKCSVAVDGISLTVADVPGQHFTVSVIPFTYQETTISHKRVGSSVNIECDIIGKYVERLLSAYEVKDAGGAGKTGAIDREFLSKHGFD